MKNMNFHITTTVEPGENHMTWHIHRDGKLIGRVFDHHHLGLFFDEYEKRQQVHLL